MDLGFQTWGLHLSVPPDSLESWQKLKNPSAAHSDRLVKALTVRGGGGTEVGCVLLGELSGSHNPDYKLGCKAHALTQPSLSWVPDLG